MTKILQGDCLKVLPTLASESVHCCVTSPPYYGLRDYDVDGQLGLEETPEEYVSKLVEVFREVRRVLRDDGTVWLNLGDSYATSGKHGSGYGEISKTAGVGNSKKGCQARDGASPGIKPKDLIGIPWRVVFALQADGADASACSAILRAREEILSAYDDETPPDRVLVVLERLAEEYRQAKRDSWWLRQDIIWHKPNPMPESIRDRCTKAHEYIFLLSKSPRYFYDAEAVKEPVSEGSKKRAEYGWDCDRPSTKNASMGGEGTHTEKMGTRFVNPSGRNKRSVWTIPTKPFKEAHFAVFPPKLVEPCILAGTSRKGRCPECGSPWVRVIQKVGETTTEKMKERGASAKRGQGGVKVTNNLDYAGGHDNNIRQSMTLGWLPTCTCQGPEHVKTLTGWRVKEKDLPEAKRLIAAAKDYKTQPCTVMDVFAGAGTTGLVATQHGRNFIGVELNADYAEMARKRIHDNAPLFIGKVND